MSIRDETADALYKCILEESKQSMTISTLATLTEAFANVASTNAGTRDASGRARRAVSG